MAARVEVDYSDAQATLQAIARRAPALKRRLSKDLRASATKVKVEQAQAVGSGTLSGAIARTLVVQTRFTGRYTGVNIRASGAKMPQRNMRRLPKYVDRGSWRHPVWGHGPRSKWAWTTQQSWSPGWFIDTGRQRLPAVKADMEQTITGYVRYLAGGL